MRKLLLAAAAMLSACEPNSAEPGASDDPSAPAALLEASELFEPIDCAGAPPLTAPPTGSRWGLASFTPDGRRRTVSALITVQSSDGSVAAYQMSLVPEQGEPSPLGPAYSRILAIMPGPAPESSGRHYAYEDDPAPALEALSPGEALRLPASETSTMEGSRRILDGVITVSHRGCGLLSQGGERQAVRVYDVEGFGRSYYRTDQGEAVDSVEHPRNRYFVAEGGWMIREENLTTGSHVETSPLAD